MDKFNLHETFKDTDKKITKPTTLLRVSYSVLGVKKILVGFRGRVG